MMESIQAIKGLERKAAEIEVWLADYGKQYDQKQTDLLHVRSAISIMKPKPASSTAVPTMSIARVFKRGEVYQRCLSLLSASAELDTGELATACLKAKDLDPEDRGLRQAMTTQITSVLTIHSNDGRIVRAGKRGATLVWRLS